VNKFADLAFRYISDPNEAVRELDRFVHEGYGMLRWDSELGHYKYGDTFLEVLDWATGFREFTEAVELGIPHSTLLKLIDLEAARRLITHTADAEHCDDKRKWVLEFFYLTASVIWNIEEVEKKFALETLLVQSSTVAASTSSKQLPQESEDEILKKLFPRPDGLKTAKKVLELTRAGKSQRQITGLVGRWPGTVSGIVKKLREAGLLPDA
jgi:hypothetical protein